MAPVTGGALFNGANGFSVVVPRGATRLEIVLHTTTPKADVDLFVRFGQDVVISSGSAVADYVSSGPTGDEQLTITASSTPPLRAVPVSLRRTPMASPASTTSS